MSRAVPSEAVEPVDYATKEKHAEKSSIDLEKGIRPREVERSATVDSVSTAVVEATPGSGATRSASCILQSDAQHT